MRKLYKIRIIVLIFHFLQSLIKEGQKDTFLPPPISWRLNPEYLIHRQQALIAEPHQEESPLLLDGEFRDLEACPSQAS